jgi:hypothetical protein
MHKGCGLREGDRIQVQVIFADPCQEMIRFQEVLTTAAEEPAKESVGESSEEWVEESAELLAGFEWF